jgi:mannose-1-phosphate guanylyltransferase
MYAVILAGGGGTRLWPLSRPERPKPFLPLVGVESLLQRTVSRLSPLIEPSDVFVVVDRRHAALAREQLDPRVRAIEEPVGRNTAPAIALATLAIERPEDEVMLVLPADHTIEREDVFRGVLRAASEGLAQQAFGIGSPLVTLGIRTDRAATEYGYLLPDYDRGDDVRGLRAYPLWAFEEKPSAERAAELRVQPGVAWNAGMFLWRRSAIRAALRAYTQLIQPLAAHGDPAALERVYETIRPISIDYAVMEPAARDALVVMGSMDVGWSDLGGWTALLAANGARGTGRVVQPGEPVALGADELLVIREAGHLVLLDGPRGTIEHHVPCALLSGAAADRDRVQALLSRVAETEAQPA